MKVFNYGFFAFLYKYLRSEPEDEGEVKMGALDSLRNCWDVWMLFLKWDFEDILKND